MERKEWLDGEILQATEDLPLSHSQKQWRARKGGREVCELTRWITSKLADRKSRGQHIASRSALACDVDDDASIDAAWILDVVRRTRLRCEYSNIQMAITPCSEWLCSFERVDNNLGYTVTNTRLVCHEFNGRGKWSSEMVKSVWPSLL